MGKKHIIIFNLQTERGFTLLELLIALTVASVLFSLMAAVLIQAGSYYHYFIGDSSRGSETLIIMNKIGREISRAVEINIENDVLDMQVYDKGEEALALHWIRYRLYQSSRGLELGFQREVSQMGEEIEFTRIDSVLGDIYDFKVDWISEELINISICRLAVSGEIISRQQTVYSGIREKQ